MFLFIGGVEIIVIILAYVMIFGAKNVPEVARQLGKGFRQLKDATNDVKREILNTADKQGIDTSIVDDFKKETNTIKESVSEITDDIQGTIRRR